MKLPLDKRDISWYTVRTQTNGAGAAGTARPLPPEVESPVNDQFTTSDAELLARHVALVVRWETLNETGEGEFTHAEFDELAAIFRHDVKTLAAVEDSRAAAVSADVLPPRCCPTCGGSGFVTVQYVSGSWADDHGPMVDYADEPCPTCRPDVGDYDDDAFDAYMAGAFAEAVA